MKKSDIVSFTIGIITLAILTVFMIKFRSKLSFFWRSNNYFYLVYAVLLIGLLFVIFRKKEAITKYKTYLKYPFYFILLPLALFPALNCWFKIPYIFCDICPRRCIWGTIRKYTIPAVLLTNLDLRFFCYKMCPFGSLQDHQAKVCPKRINLPKWLVYIRWLILLFVAAMIILTYTGYRAIPFFRGTYGFVLITAIIALIIFILAFFIPRFWCNYFCPIGSFGDIVLKIENKIKK